ncbi:MAG: 50S ribosomal protein L9 [Candidatus Buchananbacteria bacterium]
MKVILLKTIKNIGQEGDIKEVAIGYARNFLFPQKMAVEATADKIKEVEAKRAKKAQAAEADLVKAQELVNKLEGQAIEISARASDEGTLYGALPTAKIAAALKAKGFDIDKDSIKASHIKELGEHDVAIDLEHGLQARINLIINQEKK